MATARGRRRSLMVPAAESGGGRFRDVFLSWEELHRDVRTLLRGLLPLMPFKGIVAITRGGLVPAAIVARELDIRVIETLCVASYDDQDQGALRVLKEADAGDGEGWLVVDDIADTGKTARVVRDRLPKAHFAAIYAKPAGRPLVDSFVREVSQETWIHFPWDTGLSYRAPIGRGP